MSSSFGQNIKVTIFGESHGKCVGLTIDGLKPGLSIDYHRIKEFLSKRMQDHDISTPRKEEDEVIFLSGVYNDLTTGGVLTFIIENKNYDSSNYQKGIIRPSHADYTSYLKYQGKQDYRGGGMFSGRLTTPLIVLGALCSAWLTEENIKVYSHVSSIGNINDDELDLNNLDNQIKQLNESSFSTFSEKVGREMLSKILECKNNNDSIGGTIETFIPCLPIGLGEPFFDSVESVLSHLIFSVGGVKGIVFGDENVHKMLASEYNDQITYQNDEVKFLSNNNGGINGGITNGNVLYFKTYVKPTPSIFKTQKTINIETKENIELNLKGRFDTSIVHRVKEVINALTYFAIYDFLLRK